MTNQRLGRATVWLGVLAVLSTLRHRPWRHRLPLVGSLLLAILMGLSRPAAALTIYAETNLVSNIANPPGGAPNIIDLSLKDPWGITHSPTSPFWVSDLRTAVATLYGGDVQGSPFFKVALTVTIPPGPGGLQGTPTGVVFNGSSDFVLAKGNPARFLFAGLDGTISGWNSGSQAVQRVANPGATYTGLAIGSNAGGNFLYAANVRPGGTIDVFDKNFVPVTLAGSFTDPTLPPGFSPFNIQNLNGQLYVTYRNQSDPEHGGVVDVFDTDGHFLRRIASGGTLDAPWGLVLAPGDFGDFSNALLVGNSGFGDGHINAFDPDTGNFLGQLLGLGGNPFARLRGLTFGDGAGGGDPNALYFTAGINPIGPGSLAAQDGLLGRVRVSSQQAVPGPTAFVLLVTGVGALVLARGWTGRSRP